MNNRDFDSLKKKILSSNGNISAADIDKAKKGDASSLLSSLPADQKQKILKILNNKELSEKILNEYMKGKK